MCIQTIVGTMLIWFLFILCYTSTSRSIDSIDTIACDQNCLDDSHCTSEHCIPKDYRINLLDLIDTQGHGYVISKEITLKRCSSICQVHAKKNVSIKFHFFHNGIRRSPVEVRCINVTSDVKCDCPDLDDSYSYDNKDFPQQPTEQCPKEI